MCSDDNWLVNTNEYSKPIFLGRGGCRIFGKVGPNTQKKGVCPALGTMLKSRHSGPKGEGGQTPGPPYTHTDSHLVWSSGSGYNIIYIYPGFLDLW